MTRILDRLTDAMNAAADTVREDRLRPLAEPEPGRRRRRRQSRPSRAVERHWPAWIAPVAAAAAVVLLATLAVPVSNLLFGTRGAGGTAAPPAAPEPFYVATDLGTAQTTVRSTATGKIVAAVPVPAVTADTVSPALAAAGDGTFYIAAFSRHAPREQIYRFRVTTAGQVTGFGRVPGGSLRPGWTADALAASPDGSMIAVGAYWNRDHHIHGVDYPPNRADQVIVLHTATGAQRAWRGGSPAPGYRYFRAASLSWTGDSRELAVLGQWCRAATDPGGELCPAGQRQAQVRAIDPAGHGGSILSGRLLLRQSPRNPFLAQALISPDGSVITAMVLRGNVVGNPDIYGTFPQNMSVERISVAAGRRLHVLYRRRLGDTSSISGPMSDPLTLIADATGRNLILDGGICGPGCTNEFNGWLHAGRLVPLRPAGFDHREAAEAW